MDLYSQYIHKSRYARYIKEEKRREHWEETVSRYMEFMKLHLHANFGYEIPEKLYNELYNHILELKVMPSMRAMMTAGKALSRDNTAGYNCSYLPVDSPHSFDEAMHILMCGSGVGFSVERQYVNKLPEIPDKLFKSDTMIVVKDSKEGWAKALRQLIALLYSGEIPKWDTSKLRPAGATLKTFGGRSSGPGPLEDLFKFVVKTFSDAAGRKLNSIECHDIMCKIGEVVVVGGVRRSAMISLSNLSDDRMRHAKSGAWWEANPQRALSNNSAAYTEKPDVGIFMEEWLALYNSKSGERGIFNREASRKICEAIGRDPDHEFGTNPCFSGETLVAVADGRNVVSISQLAEEDKPFPVYCAAQVNYANQYQTSNIFSHWKDEVKTGIAFKTGTRQLIKVTLSTGDTFRCTPEHKLALPDGTYREAKDCLGVNLHRFYTVQNKYRRINTISNAHKNQHRMIWEYFNGEIPKGMIIDHKVSGSKDFIDNLQMMTKKDHDDKSGVERVRNNNPVHKIEDTAAWKQNLSNVMFLYNNPRFLGITNEELIENGKKLLSEGKKITLANLKKLDDRTPSSLSKNRFEGKIQVLRDICEGNVKYIEPKQMARAAKRDTQFNVVDDVKVINIENDGIEDVYDVKVEDNSNFYIITKGFDAEYNNSRGILVHNCSEIILRPNQFCNLTEVVVRSTDNEETLKEKVKIAVILGTFQSTLTNFPYLRKTWKRNTEEERLLGVSLTGIYDNKLLNNYKDKALPDMLKRLRDHARTVNEEFAEILDIPKSAAITCVKPSGTISQLVNASSGIHPRYAQYYIRRVRSDIKDPLTMHLINSGVPYEQDVMNPTNMVFSFPQEGPKSSLMRNDVSAIDHLNLWLVYQQNWCEHKPSVTVSVTEEEWPEVGAWVWNHFDLISGISFLPYDGGSYRQAPYEEITKEEYDKMKSAMPKEIDWNSLIEEEDNVEGAQTLACVAPGGCEV